MAGWPPEKNAAFTWHFVLRDADGDLVAGATSLDVEFSIDGGVFVNVAGTEVDEGEGFYSCPILAAEMNGDVIGLICKTATVGVKSAAVLIYTSTRQIDDLALASVNTEARMSELDDAGGKLVAVADLIKTESDKIALVDASAGVAGSVIEEIENRTVPADIPTAIAIADVIQEEPLEDHVSKGTQGYSSLLAVYAGSDGPGIYVDSGAANTNTVLGTDGIEATPVSTFAAARTLADALGVKIYYLEGNSDSTLDATHENWEFIGIGSVADNIVNLGSQDVDRSLFRNLTVEGTQGGTGRITTRDCALQDPGAGSTLLHIFAERCGIVDDISVDTSNDNVFDECFSLRASGAAPIITATGAAGSIIISHYGGRLELKALSASHNIELDGHGHITFNTDCNVNATLDIHGTWDVSDNTAGMSDLVGMPALINMLKINNEADIALVDYNVKGLLPTTLVNGRMDSEVQAAGFTQAAADKVWASASRTLTAISTAVALPIWQVLETAILTAGSIGLKVKTNLDALISSRSSHTAVNVRVEMDDNSVDLNSLLTLITAARMGALDDWIDGGRLDLLLDLIKVKTDALPSGPAKNVALANFEFLMVLSSDDVSPGTALTVTGEVSIDGAAFVALTNAIVEVANGFYKVNLAAVDLNGDVIGLKFTAPTANQTALVFLTT